MKFNFLTHCVCFKSLDYFLFYFDEYVQERDRAGLMNRFIICRLPPCYFISMKNGFILLIMAMRIETVK